MKETKRKKGKIIISKVGKIILSIISICIGIIFVVLSSYFTNHTPNSVDVNYKAMLFAALCSPFIVIGAISLIIACVDKGETQASYATSFYKYVRINEIDARNVGNEEINRKLRKINMNNNIHLERRNINALYKDLYISICDTACSTKLLFSTIVIEGITLFFKTNIKYNFVYSNSDKCQSIKAKESELIFNSEFERGYIECGSNHYSDAIELIRLLRGLFENEQFLFVSENGNGMISFDSSCFNKESTKIDTASPEMSNQALDELFEKTNKVYSFIKSKL